MAHAELLAQWPIKTHIVTTWIQTHKSVPYTPCPEKNGPPKHVKITL